MAPSGWNAESDRDLLLAIIEEGQLSGIKWAAVSDRMSDLDKDYSFSKEACRQHFQKIRKEARVGGSTSSQTPVKPSPAKPKPRSTTKRILTDDGEDDEEMVTPTKKSKPTPKKEPAVMKEEDQENAQSAAIFKYEDLSGEQYNVVDLEHEDLYEA